MKDASKDLNVKKTNLGNVLFHNFCKVSSSDLCMFKYLIALNLVMAFKFTFGPMKYVFYTWWKIGVKCFYQNE